MIRGIGPVYAKKLLRAFGDKVFDVIAAEPDRLREVDGIGPVRAGRIMAAWAEQKVGSRRVGGIERVDIEGEIRGTLTHDPWRLLGRPPPSPGLPCTVPSIAHLGCVEPKFGIWEDLAG